MGDGPKNILWVTNSIWHRANKKGDHEVSSTAGLSK